MRQLRIALVAALGLIALPGPARAGLDCTGIMPPLVATGKAARGLVSEDLVRLRDIGPVDPSPLYAGLFSVSPDGARAAFQLRRADPAANGYCLAMVVVDLRPGGKAVAVDSGGGFVRRTIDFRGMANFPSGVADTITPRWSPDGRWIVFRRRDGARVQLWRASADGSGSGPITDSADDIDDFRVTADGLGVVYATRPGLRIALDAIEREGRSGFHYDARFSPASSNQPFPRGPIDRAIRVLDLASGATRPATPDEAGILDTTPMEEGGWSEAMSVSGARALVRPATGTATASRGRLAVARGGATISCEAPECADASYPWWVGGTVRFLRREGWEKSATAIYEWVPTARSVRRLLVTDDVLLGCVPAGEAITCLREGSLQPRRLERLYPATGKREILFDPNPEFASLLLGRVERLRSRNGFGMESFADLVLPVGYVPGRRYPLVVVQYSSRGFLRGGTGDDYPIQAFANRGFAVLSVDRPRAIGFRTTNDFLDVDRLNLKDFADRRSALEAVEAPVRVAIDRGIADPNRIGITGLSDGSATAAFALLHSRLFSAFAMSSCCPDTSLPVRVGPGAAKQFHYMGYPRLTDETKAARAFWRHIAISPNARNIRGPILAQISDDEHWGALQSFTALRELGRPIDLYIFPGEHHIKWQPAHRLAVYTRAIDWFDYWLNGVKAPGRAEEIAHWEAMRAELAAAPASGVSKKGER